MLKSSFRRLLDMPSIKAMDLSTEQKKLWCKYQKRRFSLWCYLARRKLCVRLLEIMDREFLASKFHELHSSQSWQHAAAHAIETIMSIDKIPDNRSDFSV